MPEFFWIANHRGLDLVNTEAADQRGNRVDLLRDATDLLDWIEVAGIVPRARLEEARARSSDPAVDELLRWTRQLRAAARQLLDPAGTPTDQAVHRVDALVGAVPVRLAHPDIATDPPLASRGDVFDELRLALGRAVLDALRLDRTYVRRCGGDRCILLFYDTSRTRSRRWCDMAVCGNRAKAAAHYHRHKRAVPQ